LDNRYCNPMQSELHRPMEPNRADHLTMTCWVPVVGRLEQDEYRWRLVIRVATCRKYWPLVSVIVDPDLGRHDPAIRTISEHLCLYTHPMRDRFVSELEEYLSWFYLDGPIKLERPDK
jgi:hypothetical protein